MKRVTLFLLAGLAAGALSAGVEFEYGTCAHLTRDEFRDRARTLKMLRESGIRYLRVDLDWSNLERGRGNWHFLKTDMLVEEAEKAGVRLLPILGYNNWLAHPSHEHLAEWTNYVHAVMSRYRGKFPVVEVWNEPNLGGFWPNPSPANYVRLLLATYEAVKAEDPSVRVAISGFSQVPFDFIEGVYKAGGRAGFDIMNVHPYSWPMPPEGSLDANLVKLRKLMEKYGDADKPIWITEIGWPNARGRLSAPGLLRAGLDVVYPGDRPLRAVYADIEPRGTKPRQKTLDLVLSEMPKGSVVEYCTAGELAGRLEKGGVDVVVNPLSREGILAESVDVMANFVAKGGTVVLFGGSVMYYSFREDAEGVLRPDFTTDSREKRRRLRMAPAQAAKNADAPKTALAFPTRAAIGWLENPDAIPRSERFLSPGDLEDGDSFVPLLAGPDAAGRRDGAIAAGVYRFNGRWKGAVIASGLFEFRVGVDDEWSQASKLVRALGIAFDCGVECFFNYEFRAPEKDETDPESHFGMLHADFTPKPAFDAYRTFVKARPSGSVQAHPAVKTSSGERVSLWKRPDGRPAGMVWLPGSPGVRRVLTFGPDGGARFFDAYGRAVASEDAGAGRVSVPVSETPVYFLGAWPTEIAKPSAE